MGPNLMTNQRGSSEVDGNTLWTIIDEISPSEWRSGPSLTVSVGCTPEDIFGSREAFLAMFDTLENDSDDAERTTSDPSTPGLSDDSELLETKTLDNVLETFRKKYSEPVVIEDIR